MRLIINTIKYSTLSLLFLGMFMFASQAKAQSAIEIEFQTTPLFEALNILPGDDTTKWVRVKNNSSEEQSVAVSVDYYEDDDSLGSQMKIVISESGSPLYEGSLSDFFIGGEEFLSSISVGVEKYYDFTVSFLSEADNNYQGKSLIFNISVGVQARESIGGEDDGSSGGSGGGYIYDNLIITNEGVTVNNETATISWLTNKNATSRVIYDTVSHPDISGEVPNYYGYAYSTIEDSTKVTGHSMTILDLIPNTQYFFRPISKASPEKYGKELSFTTTDSIEKVFVLGEEGAPQLEVDLSCDKTIVVGGDEVICKIKVENNGSLTAYNVVLDDRLSDGLEFIGETSDRTWRLGHIDAGEFSSVEYLVLVDENINSGIYSNIAYVDADNSDEIITQIDLEVESVFVLGIELPATGFSVKEFAFLLSLLFTLIFSFIFFRKKLKV